jgi:hypothetical protein
MPTKMSQKSFLHKAIFLLKFIFNMKTLYMYVKLT